VPEEAKMAYLIKIGIGAGAHLKVSGFPRADFQKVKAALFAAYPASVAHRDGYAEIVNIIKSALSSTDDVYFRNDDGDDPLTFDNLDLEPDGWLPR
jgi:hypothetical protein